MRNCPNGLQTRLLMPRCWDGKKSYTALHTSNVVYAQGKGGWNGSQYSTDCPKSNPILLPTLTLEVQYNTQAFAKSFHLAANTTWPFGASFTRCHAHAAVWASGNTAAYGLHGDFLMGFDRNVFDRANRHCTLGANLAPELRCKGILTINATPQACQVSPAVDERIDGPLSALPGCNPVFGAKTGFKAPSCPSQKSPSILTPVTQMHGSAPAGVCALSGEAQIVPQVGTYAYRGCFGYDYTKPIPQFTRSFGFDFTIKRCIAKCSAAGLSSCGLMYGGECRGSSTIVKPNLLGQCNTPCKADKKHICGGLFSFSVYQKDAKPFKTTSCKRTGMGSTKSSSGKTKSKKGRRSGLAIDL